MKWNDYFWLVIPVGIILLIILSVIYIPSEPYDQNFDPRIENCGPGMTTC